MAQILVRNLDDDVRDRLRDRAARNGRSMEEEVREILRAAVLSERRRERTGLGEGIVSRFRRIGLDEPIPELRGEQARHADLGG